MDPIPHPILLHWVSSSTDSTCTCWRCSRRILAKVRLDDLLRPFQLYDSMNAESTAGGPQKPPGCDQVTSSSVLKREETNVPKLCRGIPPRMTRNHWHVQEVPSGCIQEACREGWQVAHDFQKARRTPQVHTAALQILIIH